MSMMVSTRGRYALRVMIDLAEHQGEEYIPMKTVAERQDISLKYLETIMPKLVANNLVEGLHGKGGGYKLTKKPGEYTILEILSTTEAGLSCVSCLESGAAPCEKKDTCRTIGMWTGLNKVIEEYLSGVTLEDLLLKEN